MSEPSVVATRLSYSVGDVSLLARASIAAYPGQLVVLIGPNGAGKSTMLNLLAGNLRPTGGTTTLNGVDASTAVPSELATIRSFLTQRARIDLPYSTRQVVEIGRFPHRRNPNNTRAHDQAVVADAMARTETSWLAGRTYSTLSSGEQTLVSLARVLAQDTPIVFLDEPTTALDVAHQERSMRLVRRMAHEGRTVLAVLHDLNAAAAYADQVVLMGDGRVVETGRPGQVLTALLLSEVYGHPLMVVDHPTRDCPLVLPGDT